MSVLKHAIARKRLSKLLSIAKDEEFFLLMWAIDAIQAGNASAVTRAIMTYPQDAVTTDGRSRYFVHKWKIETLVNELLVTPKQPRRAKTKDRYLKCKLFDAAVNCLIALGKLENADDAVALTRMEILNEVHRIGQRQFEWQRGFYSHAQLYRAIFVFGYDLSGAYFQRTYGLTIQQFSHFGFVLYAVLSESPALQSGAEFDDVGITNTVRDAGLRMVCASISDIRAQALRIRQPGSGRGHISYQPSILRSFPSVAFGDQAERIRAPLPSLFLWRTTAGLYYDVIKGGAQVRNEIGARFEEYARNLLQAMLPSYSVFPSRQYLYRGNKVDTPDILIKTKGDVIFAIECKSKKMTLGAKFGEFPIEEEDGYQEIVKGVIQLWRFFSHHRRGLIQGEIMRHDAIGIVLTLEPWLQMSVPLRRDVIAAANARADGPNQDIADDDRRPIIFCSIEDLESVLRVASECKVVGALRSAVLNEYQGWTVTNVHNNISDERLDRPFPFADKLSDILPWWNMSQAKPEAQSFG